MAIEKHLVATVGDSGKLYFVAGADKFDGIYSDGTNQAPVSFMTFIATNPEVVPLKENDYQKFLWSMDFDDQKWQSEFIKLIPRRTETNPYNEKVQISMRSLEKTSKQTYFNKHIKS
jgi:hypothetical protein